MKKFGLVLLLALTIFSCKKKDITWNSDWSLPLVNDTLSLENWVNDSTLGVNSGFYELQLRRLLYDLDINDLIEIPDTTIEQDFTFALSSFIANPGFTFVSSTEEHNININDVELKVITLRKGYIDVEVRNVVPTTAIFNVKLPGVSKNGVVFEEQYSAPPGTNANPGIVRKTIDLSGYTLVLTGTSGAASNRLLSQVKVSTSPSGQAVTITNQDITKVIATFRGVEIDYAKGYFGNLLLDETDTIALEPMNIYQSGLLDIGNTNMKFTVENGIKVSAKAKLFSLESWNNQGSIVSLSHPLVNSEMVVNPASGYWNTLVPSETTILANSGNSNVENVIENLGNKYEVDYQLELNPWGNVSGSTDEFFPNSRFRIYLEANMPLLLGMNNLVLQDTFDIRVDQSASAMEIESGQLIIKSANSFPMSANIDLFLLDEQGQLVSQVVSAGQIKSGSFGAPEGIYGLNTSHSELTYTLDEETIDKLNVIRKVVVRARMNTIDPITLLPIQVQIPEHAFLSVKMRSEFKTTNKL